MSHTLTERLSSGTYKRHSHDALESLALVAFEDHPSSTGGDGTSWSVSDGGTATLAELELDSLLLERSGDDPNPFGLARTVRGRSRRSGA